MKLHIAIHQAINDFGSQIIAEDKLINILADYAAFKEVSATKQVLRDLITNGYGNKIYLLELNGSNWDIGIKTIETEFIRIKGYKDQLVHYVLECIAFAFGYIESVVEYSVGESVDHFIDSNKTKVIKDFAKELVNLQSEYTNLLSSLYEAPAVESIAVKGIYSAEAVAQLWFVEQKIVIIYNALGQTYDNWCEKQKSSFLQLKEKARLNILKEQLAYTKQHYISLLLSLITIPKTKIYAKSGYYDDSSSKMLLSEEEQIKKLDKILGTTELKLCLEEKQRVLLKYKQSTGKQLFQFCYKVVAPVLAMIISISTYVNYSVSKPYIAQYERDIAIADSLYNAELYMDAISAYNLAKDNYKGEFNVNKYHDAAQSKRDITAQKLLTQRLDVSSALLQFGDYLGAQNNLDEIKGVMLSTQMSNQYNLQVTKLQQDIEQEIERGYNYLIINIRANKGRLDSQGKELFESLLAVAPDNYWLNVIKKKQKI